MSLAASEPIGQARLSRRLDVDHTAEYLGVSSSFLNKARLTGRGPVFIKLGSRVVYDVADLDTWLAAQRRSSTSQCLASVGVAA